jgi:hypothetical protein
VEISSEYGRAEVMAMWWPVRAMYRLWVWAIPGLIALEPAAMGLYVTSGDIDRSPNTSADSLTGLTRDLKHVRPSQTVWSQLRVEEFGK